MSNKIKGIILVLVLSIIVLTLLLVLLSVLSNGYKITNKIEIGDEVYYICYTSINESTIIKGTVIAVTCQDNEIVKYGVLPPRVINLGAVYIYQEDVFLTYNQALKYVLRLSN
jgi:hypothetical protein